MRVGAPAELLRELARERDRVPLDHQIEVEALLAEQHVANGAADEVDAVVGGGDRLHLGQDALKSLDPCQAGLDRLARLGAGNGLCTVSGSRSARSTSPPVITPSAAPAATRSSVR